MAFLTDYNYLITLILAIMIVILFLWLIILTVKLTKIQNKYNRLTRGLHIGNLEDLLLQQIKSTELVQKQVKIIERELDVLGRITAKAKGKLGIYRYNAFGEKGNDLSFSLALLNNDRDGIVLTSIYNREQSNVYAKPIKNGESTYKLSPEEIKAIEKATLDSE